MRNKYYIIGGVSFAAFLVVGIFIGAHFTHKHTSSTSTLKHSNTQTLYYCPMHPSYTSEGPGECPICGMTLVPMRKEEAPKDEEARPVGEDHVIISLTRQQLIGVKKATVKIGPAVKTIRTVGKVAFDPELATAEREYIEAVKVGDKNLADAARQRLRLMGLGEDQIKGLKGKVQRNLYLPDKSAWVYPIIYEYELPNVTVGQSVTIELPEGHGTRVGTVLAIDPVIDQTTRTARLRIEVPNDDGALKPNMFVNAVIESDLGRRILVPKDAVIDSGERRIVFVVHDGTMFIPQEVKLGPELDNDFVVEAGLHEGDEVVTSANFLVDAESKLKSALGSMTGHKHGD